MKIIFDSEKQKKDFIQELADFCSCPRQFSLDECCDWKNYNATECLKCWENAIECEVKGKE